jgi:hypothetical protein
VVFEDTEEPVEAHIDARRLDHARVVRFDLDPPGIDLLADVTVTEQH